MAEKQEREDNMDLDDISTDEEEQADEPEEAENQHDVRGRIPRLP